MVSSRRLLLFPSAGYLVAGMRRGGQTVVNGRLLRVVTSMETFVKLIRYKPNSYHGRSRLTGFGRRCSRHVLGSTSSAILALAPYLQVDMPHALKSFSWFYCAARRRFPQDCSRASNIPDAPRSTSLYMQEVRAVIKLTRGNVN